MGSSQGKHRIEISETAMCALSDELEKIKEELSVSSASVYEAFRDETEFFSNGVESIENDANPRRERVGLIEELLAKTTVVCSKQPEGIVTVNTLVTYKLNGVREKAIFDGAQYDRPDYSVLSFEGLLGKAILGRSVDGEKITYFTDRGNKMKVEIVEIVEAPEIPIPEESPTTNSRSMAFA